MFKTFKMVREGLKDPKKNAITKLALYLVFFIIVFLLIANAEKNADYTVKEDNNVNYYNYTYEVNFNNNITNINGIYSDEEYFMYKNNKYIIKNNDIYLDDVVVSNPLEFDVQDFYYDSIEKLIDKSEFISKTTYKDGKVETIYNIKVSDYFGDSNYECTNNCDNNIVITVDDNEYINSVVIDLTSVNNINYTISIEYKKISD